MKNQYFGDINDYFKYRLLRKVEKDCGLKIGLCWMLTQNDDTKEGGKIDYLNQEKNGGISISSFLIFLNHVFVIGCAIIAKEASRC
mgnify:CR=1 FL=1